MAEIVANGVSPRKVSRVIENLCGTSVSKSYIPDICKNLYNKVEPFRNRPSERCYPFMTVDTTYFKVREKNRVIAKARIIAYGTNEQEHREVICFST